MTTDWHSHNHKIAWATGSGTGKHQVIWKMKITKEYVTMHNRIDQFTQEWQFDGLETSVVRVL